MKKLALVAAAVLALSATAANAAPVQPSVASNPS